MRLPGLSGSASMLDPRLRERPALYLLGLLLFAGLAACCLYQFSSGLALGEVRCIPLHSRSCRRRADPFYSLEEEPVFFVGDLVFWLWFAAACAACAWYFRGLIVGAGGLFATERERCLRRIARMRCSIDEGIFMFLANMAPVGWSSIRLELAWETRQGEERLRHTLEGPHGHSKGVGFPVYFFRTTGQLLDLFQKHGERFRRTVYALERGADHRWKRTLTIE
jgi:hypothetical protein